jgi:hypothetical protein
MSVLKLSCIATAARCSCATCRPEPQSIEGSRLCCAVLLARRAGPLETLGCDLLRLRYVRQAVASYVAGTPTACVVLCRATLESALKAALERPTTTIGLEELIRRAEVQRLLATPAVTRARSVWQLGNARLHAGNATSDEAYTAIVSVREVLREFAWR